MLKLMNTFFVYNIIRHNTKLCKKSYVNIKNMMLFPIATFIVVVILSKLDENGILSSRLVNG